MKYILWILASIGALTVAGSFYVSPDIQYQSIYWFLKIATSILGFIIIVWIWVKIHGDNDNEYNYNRQSKNEKWVELLDLYWVPLLYLIIIIGSQFLIWKSTHVDNQIAQFSKTVSSNIEFPWGWEPPHFYIGGKPQK